MKFDNEAPSLITTGIDYEKAGYQQGTLRVPYSHDRSAYGHIPIPIAVLNNGQGPTVLLTGGNHGDEYEGPVALMKLVREMSRMTIHGRLIVIPALNFPAFMNGTRTSPIDRANLNRSFPGRANGSPTELIAHYIERELLPMTDLFIDLHAGGSSMNYVPTLFATPPADPAKLALYRRLADAFAVPHLVLMDLLGEMRTSGSAAWRAGTMFFTGEFGGYASCNPEYTRLVEAGLQEVLRVFGVCPDAPVALPSPPSRHLKVNGAAHYLFAERAGVFEPSFHLGDEVLAGDVAGWIHDPGAPWDVPQEVRFAGSGKVLCVRTFAGVQAGDCLGHLGSDTLWQ